MDKKLREEQEVREQRQRIREQNEKRQVYMMRQKAKVEVY